MFVIRAVPTGAQSFEAGSHAVLVGDEAIDDRVALVKTHERDLFVVTCFVQRRLSASLRFGKQTFATHAQRVVDQDDGRAGGVVVSRGAATVEERTRERDHDQQDRETAKQQQQQIVQRAAANCALRNLAHEDERRELHA